MANRIGARLVNARLADREMLTGFLDWYRAIVEHKVEGLSLEEASRQLTGTGLSLLGVVMHLGWVEYYWFRFVFAGEDVDAPPRENDDNSVQFRIGSDETVGSVVDFYRTQSQHARRIESSARSLEDLSAREARIIGGDVTLRWILIHMIEETARHAGQMDLMREAVDNQTGYL